MKTIGVLPARDAAHTKAQGRNPTPGMVPTAGQPAPLSANSRIPPPRGRRNSRNTNNKTVRPAFPNTCPSLAPYPNVPRWRTSESSARRSTTRDSFIRTSLNTVSVSPALAPADRPNLFNGAKPRPKATPERHNASGRYPAQAGQEDERSTCPNAIMRRGYALCKNA